MTRPPLATPTAALPPANVRPQPKVADWPCSSLRSTSDKCEPQGASCPPRPVLAAPAHSAVTGQASGVVCSSDRPAQPPGPLAQAGPSVRRRRGLSASLHVPGALTLKIPFHRKDQEAQPRGHQPCCLCVRTTHTRAHTHTPALPSISKMNRSCAPVPTWPSQHGQETRKMSWAQAVWRCALHHPLNTRGHQTGTSQAI